jgi:hypothetical protein
MTCCSGQDYVQTLLALALHGRASSQYRCCTRQTLNVNKNLTVLPEHYLELDADAALRRRDLAKAGAAQQLRQRVAGLRFTVYEKQVL